MTSVTASVARQTLPAQLDRVEAGEEVSITRHGRVVAVLVSPDVLAARRASMMWSLADRIEVRLDQARGEPLGSPPISAARAAELVAGIDADRSE